MFEKRAVKILTDLIRIKSITFNEFEAAQYIKSFLFELGFKVEIDESYNVIAELKGSGGGSRVFFLGHHDTVEEGDHALWMHPPFDAVALEGEIYGRGAVDDKGGVAACLAALEEFISENGQNIKGDILFVSSREETSEIHTRGILKVLEKGINADFCIVLEPTNLDIILGHKGRAVLDITTFGKTAHSSVPEKGINAINHMSHVIVELEKMVLPNRAPLGQGTQSIGVINGGVRPNIVPERCSIEIDRRIVGEETLESIYHETQQAIDKVKERIPELNTEVKIRPPFYPSYIEEDSLIVKMVKSISDELDIKNKVCYMDGHTDGEWVINDAKIPAIVLGPGDMKLAHAANEKVSVEELSTAAKIYYEVMKKNIL